MNKLIILLLIFIASCTIVPCERFYLYSATQEAELKTIDSSYESKTVNDSAFTVITESKAGFDFYKQKYPDMRIVKVGCVDTLIIK